MIPHTRKEKEGALEVERAQKRKQQAGEMGENITSKEEDGQTKQSQPIRGNEQFLHLQEYYPQILYTPISSNNLTEIWHSTGNFSDTASTISCASSTEDEAHFTRVSISACLPLKPTNVQRFIALLDTGSFVNLISEHAAIRLGIQHLNLPTKVLIALGNVIIALGEVEVWFCLGNSDNAKIYKETFVIVRDADRGRVFNILLGAKTISKSGLLRRNIDSILVVDDTRSEVASILDDSTLVPIEDSALTVAIDAVVANSARILSEEIQIKPLHAAAVLRLDHVTFEQNISKLLRNFSCDLSKDATSGAGKSVAWLIRNKAVAITKRIRTKFAPEDIDRKKAMANLQNTPSEGMEHLHRFVQQKFPEPSNAARGDPVEVPEPEIEHGNDEALDLPTGEAFGSIDHLKGLLISREAYVKFRDSYQQFVFPRSRDVIDKVLGEHLPVNREYHRIACRIECQVLEYLEETFGDTKKFGSIMTITGQPSHAILAKAGDYLRETWSTGDTMADAVESALDGKGLGSTYQLASGHHMTLRFRRQGDQGSAEGSERHDLQMEGNQVQLCQSLEMLAWIIAVFRRPIQDHLTVSEIDFGFIGGADECPHFVLSLVPLSTSFPVRADEDGQCWTSMFPRSILAYGFPVPIQRRPDGIIGLEIPFEILTFFAGIRFPLRLEQGLVLAGLSTLLVPGRKTENAIQWHYLFGENRFERLRDLIKPTDLSFQGEDWNDLVRPTAFLGHLKYAAVQLGTEGLGTNRITASQVAKAGPRLGLEHKGTVSAGLSKYATAWATLGWKISNRETAVVLNRDLHLSDRLERAKNTPTLLYDDETCRAWLVAELSVALHMAHAQLSGKNLGSAVKQKIPIAKKASNGGDAALEAIKKAANLTISFDVGPLREFSDIVDEFLTTFEQARQQESALEMMTQISLQDGLRGWDFEQLQTRARQIDLRELPRPSKWRRSPIWWKLFKSSKALVIFGRNIGCPIQSSPEAPESYCVSWNTIPEGHHLLIASVPPLKQLKRLMCTDSDGLQGQYMLSNELGWARPNGSRLFGPCVDGESCTPVQGMQVVGRGQLWKAGPMCNSEPLMPPPEDLEIDGAVIFADKPGKIGRRTCQVRDPVGYWERRHRFLTTHLRPHVQSSLQSSPLFVFLACLALLLWFQ